ncbi:Gp138 family membrane-puncturing spike protein [Commensalibacter papalotli (ex Servin-Garciduenas et al. 2014)]|uniref:Phage baseplate assembly protein n=1 Tax=Commensalibacter papalotli (ex Servin-Garciduenas et al. 2014) TaxID=1208583 RepID=W7E194_9PROT|nr:Gp138 family membrane-puncturing spike protein [Commensalibacter papalotli (ex Servin-Garciduenas et al. 2014)]EUK18829.1 phage baseplate assembly protein [Commensalibacter papalotli (ex Servin-Garciduenas et al. 2014)]
MAGKRSVNCEENLINTRIKAQIKNINTATIVKVLSVDTTSKTVRVQPMVQMSDSKNQSVDHAEINDIPYTRLQGGTYGIICDPVVGDIGLVVFCSRDISNVKENKKVTAQASKRAYSLSDGIYIASLLLDEPTTYLKIDVNGVEIKGRLTVSDDVIIAGKSFNSHVHGKGHNGDNTTEPVGSV